MSDMVLELHAVLDEDLDFEPIPLAALASPGCALVPYQLGTPVPVGFRFTFEIEEELYVTGCLIRFASVPMAPMWTPFSRAYRLAAGDIMCVTFHDSARARGSNRG